MRSSVGADVIVKARRFASDYYRKHKEEYEGYHPSHLGSKAIEEAGKKFNIGFGCEGFCLDEAGRDGISYLNMGDTYEYTVLFDSRTERFSTGCWGDLLEKLGRQGITIR